MFDLDPGKLLVIAVVAILVLGPDKLPQAAHRVGAMWRSFDEFRHKMEAEVRTTIPDLPSTSELARLARSPAALLNHLGDIGNDTVDLPDVADVAADGGPGDSTAPNTAPASISVAPGLAAAAAGVAESSLSPVAAALGDASLN